VSETTTVIVNRRDLLLALSSTPLGQGKEKDAALKRLQLAAVYEPAKPDTVVARFHTRTDTLERDERIARLSRERLTDTEIMIREGVTKNTVTAARKRIMARQNMDGIREAFLGDLEAVLFNAWQIVHDPPPRVSQHGKPVTTKIPDPDTGELREVQIPDMERVISALDLARKTVADMRTLTGADAPKKTISAKVDLREEAERQWKELFGAQVTAEVIASE
jgi:DNA-binding CsgD family transcriptional regulator